MFAIGQVCVHIKYVSTGKAYWLDATTFEWSDNGLDQMIDSLCKYVFAVASCTFLSSYLVFSKTPRNLQVGVMLFQALDRFKTPYLHIWSGPSDAYKLKFSSFSSFSKSQTVCDVYE